MLEELVGYLLDALDPDEWERVAQFLNADEESRLEAQRLRSVLARWDGCRIVHQAPAGLAVRTCTSIFAAQEEPA